MDPFQFLTANSGAITINGTNAYTASPLAGVKIMDDTTVIDHIYVNNVSVDVKDQLIVGNSSAAQEAGTIIRPLNGSIITSFKLAVAGSVNAIIDSSNDQ
jgi:hypothetical protein